MPDNKMKKTDILVELFDKNKINLSLYKIILSSIVDFASQSEKDFLDYIESNASLLKNIYRFACSLFEDLTLREIHRLDRESLNTIVDTTVFVCLLSATGHFKFPGSAKALFRIYRVFVMYIDDEKLKLINDVLYYAEKRYREKSIPFGAILSKVDPVELASRFSRILPEIHKGSHVVKKFVTFYVTFFKRNTGLVEELLNYLKVKAITSSLPVEDVSDLINIIQKIEMISSFSTAERYKAITEGLSEYIANFFSREVDRSEIFLLFPGSLYSSLTSGEIVRNSFYQTPGKNGVPYISCSSTIDLKLKTISEIVPLLIDEFRTLFSRTAAKQNEKEKREESFSVPDRLYKTLHSFLNALVEYFFLRQLDHFIGIDLTTPECINVCREIEKFSVFHPISQILFTYSCSIENIANVFAKDKLPTFIESLKRLIVQYKSQRSEESDTGKLLSIVGSLNGVNFLSLISTEVSAEDSKSVQKIKKEICKKLREKTLRSQCDVIFSGDVLYTYASLNSPELKRYFRKKVETLLDRKYSEMLDAFDPERCDRKNVSLLYSFLLFIWHFKEFLRIYVRSSYTLSFTCNLRNFKEDFLTFDLSSWEKCLFAVMLSSLSATLKRKVVETFSYDTLSNCHFKSEELPVLKLSLDECLKVAHEIALTGDPGSS